MVQLKQHSTSTNTTSQTQSHHQEYFTPVSATSGHSSTTTSEQRWQHIKQAISPPDSPSGTMSSSTTPDPLRARLVDQHNVVQCPDCTKPILESALAQHAVNCQKIRDRAQQQMADGGRKRRLSDAAADDASQQKKARSLSLVLTLGDTTKQQQNQQPSPNGSQAPKIVLKDQKDKPHRPRGPIDLDKHCGVINDKGLPCSRSLTCKTHAMGAKRSVPHRSRPYDDLLADWQRAKMAANANNPTSGNLSGGAASSRARGGDSEIDAEGDSPAGQPLSASVTPAAAPYAMLPPAPGIGGTGGVVKEKKRKRKNHQGEYGTGAGPGGIAGSGSGMYGSGKERRTRAGGEGGKKGLLVVGEWEDVVDSTNPTAGDDDLLIDSDEEVEAVLKGLARVRPSSSASSGAAPVGVVGRPLSMFTGGGAGFAASSFFVGRNYRLARLRDTLGGVFATRS